MRVAVVGSQLFALVNFRGSLMREMVARGHEVVAICPPGPTQYTDQLQAWGVGYRPIFLERTGLNPLRDLQTMQSYAAAFRETAPQVIYAYNIKPIIYGSWAARSVGIQDIYSTVTGLAHVFLNDSLRGKAVRFVAKRMYQAAFFFNRKVFFQNEDDRQSFVRWGIVPQDKTCIVNGSGVDIARFTPSEVPISPVRFVYIGRLLREKGILELMEAMRLVKQRFPEAMLDLVGGLDANPSSVGEAEVAAWEREGLIQRIGFVDDVRPYLERASVMVLPSYREGTSRAILEALAVGRPVVTTDVPGCRDPISDGENGYLVAPRDGQALAEALMRCVQAPERLREMGAAARHLAETRYDVKLVNADILHHMAL